VPEQVTDSCAAIGPQAEAAFIADCGHVPHLEHPQAVIDRTRVFLAEAGLV
jgi:pimeloyl-ACP methyl ester carboxylesterase